MSYTSRLRLALVLIALVPPLVAVGAVYFYSSQQATSAFEQRIVHQVGRFAGFRETFEKAVAQSATAATELSRIQRALLQLDRSPRQRVDISPMPDGLDFVELVDSSGRVLASVHRPGLVGGKVALPGSFDEAAYSTEYDLKGRHAAIAFSRRASANVFLLGGRYFDRSVVENVRSLLEANVAVQFGDELDQTLYRYAPLALYEHDDVVQAVLLGSEQAGYLVTVTFARPTAGPMVTSLITVTVVVSLLSVLAAIAIGWYLTGKAKREIENLVEASHRIARGDFVTPVMAYEEGQFSQLADAFSDMMSNLRRVQRELASAEKIAAWQAMGRKIAHEVKNPLTPIAISVDDLRRSFEEKQPRFDEILYETTGTIKVEIGRLTRLLDQFVSFARMSPPEVKSVSVEPLFERIALLYRTQMADGRVVLNNSLGKVSLAYDIDRIEQVLVNLIKNGLEAAPDARVHVSINEAELPVISVADTGPGFPADVLEHQFEPRVSSKSDGFGLGLVICQRIVYDHGGEIWISNRDKGGAVVSFTLRRADG